MRIKLPYFTVENELGFNQEHFSDIMMKLGGCAAVTACDSLIYFKKYFSLDMPCPCAADDISRSDYTAFARKMKPYLRPRLKGISSTEIYVNGVRSYLDSVGCKNLSLSGCDNVSDTAETEKIITSQLEKGYPLPCLTLGNGHRDMKDFVWHWYMVTGYESMGTETYVNAVSYGGERRLRLSHLWQKGGGLIIFSLTD